MPQKKSSSAKVAKLLRFFLSAESKRAWAENRSEVELTEAHRRSHVQNRALQSWFQKIYALHRQNFATGGPSVELGSGGSQLKQAMPELVTTDILPLPEIDQMVDALAMPYADQSVANLTMINVLHHLPAPLKFFAEANRVLKNGGRLVFTEPYVSLISYPIYRFVHHEPCELHQHILNLDAGSKALLDSNQAMPTQLIRKYLSEIRRVAPALKIKEIKYHSSLIYFLSGGVNYRPLVPLWLWRVLEKGDAFICLLMGRFIASFFTVVFEKTEPLKRADKHATSFQK